MSNSLALRHVCGEVIRVEIFNLHGENVPAYFHREDRETVGIPIYNCPGCGEALDLDWCGAPYRVEPMPQLVAERTMREMYCSNCWQYDLYMEIARDLEGVGVGYLVLCSTCQEETIGYISPVWKDHKWAEDRIRYRDNVEALSTLMDISIPDDALMVSDFQPEETLKELGF